MPPHSRQGSALNPLIALGQPAFAAGLLALGAAGLIYPDPSTLSPLPGPGGWMYWFSAALLTAGGAILLRQRARLATISLGALLLLWLLLFYLPLLTQQPRNEAAWHCALETLALCGTAWVLTGTLGSELPVRQPSDRLLDHAARAGRYAFAAALTMLGVLYLADAGPATQLVPAWLPFPALWAGLAGIAHAAAGLGILCGVQARLAATLTGAMYAAAALLLHLPRALTHLPPRAEWTSLSVSLALCGAAWLIADSFQPARGSARVRCAHR